MTKPYCLYLRKSRADLEAEARGEGETLSRHRRTLMELAGRMKLPVGQIYEEIATGESIAARPQMQLMLAAIEAEDWAGVICMDVDRLARGDSIDQGIISQAFLYSGAVIVTPGKVYDPRNESDSEFFEMKMFFSRREYNQIRKRLQEGRKRSVLDGRYMGTRPPYGYERIKISGDKGWTLEIVPEKAEVVRSIFDWYIHGMDGEMVGGKRIATRLNDMGLRTDMGNPFTGSTILTMLLNPAYIGMVRWNQRVTTIKIKDGEKIRSRPRSDDAILARGLHEAIIGEDVWRAAQERHKSRYAPRTHADLATANPLAGLVVCAECGKHLQRKPCPKDAYGRDALLFCPTPRCKTTGIYVSLLERAVLETLEGWTVAYAAEDTVKAGSGNDVAEAAARQMTQQIDMLRGQMSRLHDLLEQGVYSTDVFLSRQRELATRITEAEQKIAEVQGKPKRADRAEAIRSILPAVRDVLDAYALAPSAAEKNALLKTVIARIDYDKSVRCYRRQDPLKQLRIVVHPRVPEDRG